MAGAQMASPNSRDRELIERLVRHTGKSASAVAKMAGLAASTLTRVAHGKTDHRLSVPTLEALQAKFPELFGDLSDIPDAPEETYVEVEVLPSFAGAGGGGYGEGEP